LVSEWVGIALRLELTEIRDWIDNLSDEWVLYIKRLSSNDTGLTGGHQVGVYIPKNVMKRVVPEIQRLDIKNPDYQFPVRIVSHDFPEQVIRAVYYNSGPRGVGTRNEQRITRWNTGVSGSPMQDEDNTGALCLFAFHLPQPGMNSDYLQVWICRNEAEEELIEAYTGEIVPGQYVSGIATEVLGGLGTLPVARCEMLALPDEWQSRFPDGKTIVEYVVQQLQFPYLSSDEILIKRRNCEFSVFRTVEEQHILDKIKCGFQSVDEFISFANSVSNRRKSRSGRSLELHLEKIFLEKGLRTFGTQCITEERKTPDFLFPSCEKYHDYSWPDNKLHMLGVKTTCKDRWRQILNEANRISAPHLFTLQEGVSEHQFNEMVAENVMLVVPKPLHNKYPKTVRTKLLSLDDFIAKMKAQF